MQASRQKRWHNIVDDTLEDLLQSITTPLPGQTPEEMENARIIANRTRQTVRNIVGFLFPLDSIQEIPGFGALVAVFFDIVKAFLLMAAGGSVTLLPTLIGLIPLPLTGTVGTAIGWFVSLIFLVPYAAISLSRKEFSDTMRSIFMMVPVVGSVLGTTFQSGVSTGTNIANRYDLLKEQAGVLWGRVQTAIDKTREDVSVRLRSSQALQNIQGAVSKLTTVGEELGGTPPVTGGKRFTRRRRIGRKWKTHHRRHRSKKH